MALVIPIGYAQATFLFTGDPLPTGAATTLGLELTGTPDPFDLANDVLDAWIAGGMSGFYTSSITLTAIRVKYGPVDLGPFVEILAGVGGVLTGDSMPANTASLVRKVTAAGGRPNRGRMFIPGVSEGSVSGNNRWIGAQQVARQGNLDDFFDALVSADAFPVVFHDESSPVSTPTTITSLQLDSLLATQRRRMRR